MHQGMNSWVDLRVTIPSGGTESTAFRTIGYSRLAVETPSALTGTALAVEGAHSEDGTFKPLQDVGGGAVSEAAAADQVVLFGPVLLPKWVRIVSNDTEVAARELTVYMKSA